MQLHYFVNMDNKKRIQTQQKLPKISSDSIMEISKILNKQIDRELFEKKYTPVKNVLMLVGAGLFLAGSLAMPNLPLVLKPFLDHKRKSEMNIWKRFNIPYLKRTLKRLEKQRLVEFSENHGMQIVKITEAGQRKILSFAIDELAVEKPKIWDGKWTIVSYDIPKTIRVRSNTLREYLKAWGFYPFHKSLYLHAFPCQKQIEFLREYLGVSEYVRIFKVSSIERDKVFRDFFGV